MTEAYESVLRKSLDTVDRKRKMMKIITIAFLVLGSGMIALTMHDLQFFLHDIKSLYIVTIVSLVYWMTGLGMAILIVSNRNTKLTLQAIALLSEELRNTKSEHQKEGSAQ